MKQGKYFKEEWKSELESNIYLSAKSKQALMEKAATSHVKEKTHRKWSYPVVLSSFVLGAVFFLFITFQNQPNSMTATSNHLFTSDLKLTDLFLSEKFYWMLGVFLIEIIAGILFFEVIQKTKRWQSRALVSKISALLASWPRKLAFQCFCSILIGGALFFASLYTVKTLAVLFVLLLNCLLLLWLVRNLEKATCPHCGQPFTRKDLFKITWAPYRLKCIHCQGNIYLSKDSRKNMIHYTWAPFVSHYVLGFLGIPIPYLAFSFILVGVFFNFYIMNFTYGFSKEDEPLW